jgi:hypothetical protein
MCVVELFELNSIRNVIPMKHHLKRLLTFLLFLSSALIVSAQQHEPAVPFFEDGEAQIVKAFEDPEYWIREDLWVETEFDSDGNGRPDRMHVDVTRPREIEIDGLKLPVITIAAASSKPAVNLSVYLVSLPWNEGRRIKITDNIITRGWADLQNYKSLRESEPLKPGKFYEMTFELQPDDQIIRAGQQIGLMIFSSDSEFTLLPKPGTELTVDLDRTSIKIPVVGGKAAYQKALAD